MVLPGRMYRTGVTILVHRFAGGDEYWRREIWGEGLRRRRISAALQDSWIVPSAGRVLKTSFCGRGSAVADLRLRPRRIWANAVGHKASCYNQSFLFDTRWGVRGDGFGGGVTILVHGLAGQDCSGQSGGKGWTRVRGSGIQACAPRRR